MNLIKEILRTHQGLFFNMYVYRWSIPGFFYWNWLSCSDVPDCSPFLTGIFHSPWKTAGWCWSNLYTSGHSIPMCGELYLEKARKKYKPSAYYQEITCRNSHKWEKLLAIEIWNQQGASAKRQSTDFSCYISHTLSFAIFLLPLSYAFLLTLPHSISLPLLSFAGRRMAFAICLTLLLPLGNNVTD